MTLDANEVLRRLETRLVEAEAQAKALRSAVEIVKSEMTIQTPAANGSVRAPSEGGPTRSSTAEQKPEAQSSAAAVPKRIHSVELVARFVTSLDRPVSRQEAFEAFEAGGHVPPAWKHPRNAFLTALGRAVQRGQLEYNQSTQTYRALHGER